MKQGESKRLKPKDKHTKESWKKRDALRKDKQEAHALALLSVPTEADTPVEEVTNE